jgi:hypothetical protein
LSSRTAPRSSEPGDYLILLGDSRNVEAALDRVEGRARPFAPAVAPGVGLRRDLRTCVGVVLWLLPRIAEAAQAAGDVELPWMPRRSSSSQT